MNQTETTPHSVPRAAGFAIGTHPGNPRRMLNPPAQPRSVRPNREVAPPAAAVLGDSPEPAPLAALANERQLLARARTDSAALAELYRLHVERIDKYVRRRVGTNADAEDIVANVFLAMVKHIHRFVGHDKPLVAWLYRVATNEIHRWLRRRRVLRFFHLSAEVPIPPAADVDNAEYVRGLLARLPSAYQSVLALHYLEGLSVAEIAAVVSISEGAVKTRLMRGREMFRHQLEHAERRICVPVSSH